MNHTITQCSFTLSASAEIGIDGITLGRTDSVSTTWKKTKDQEFRNKNFYEKEENEKITYSKDSRQLWRTEKVTIEIERRLKGKRIGSTGSTESVDTKYVSAIPKKECGAADRNRLHELEEQDIKVLQETANKAKISGTISKNKLVEEKCGKDRKYYNANF